LNGGREPLARSLFAGGGMAAALLLPAIVAVAFLTGPLGWLGPDGREGWMAWYSSPAFRLFLSLFLPVLFLHAAQRFRYTLYDGLQLYHLDRLTSWGTYGVAVAGRDRAEPTARALLYAGLPASTPHPWRSRWATVRSAFRSQATKSRRIAAV